METRQRGLETALLTRAEWTPYHSLRLTAMVAVREGVVVSPLMLRSRSPLLRRPTRPCPDTTCSSSAVAATSPQHSHPHERTLFHVFAPSHTPAGCHVIMKTYFCAFFLSLTWPMGTFVSMSSRQPSSSAHSFSAFADGHTNFCAHSSLSTSFIDCESRKVSHDSVQCIAAREEHRRYGVLTSLTSSR